MSFAAALTRTFMAITASAYPACCAVLECLVVSNHSKLFCRLLYRALHRMEMKNRHPEYYPIEGKINEVAAASVVLA
jgi:hypothetical protein